ncbi:hypothetical protein LEAN103870_11505 [Legionella anisa]|uniref:Transposase n=1 Tax=Legionella anisa TaxID=28082 RepID=A0AAX0WWA5_9GAMM|nr:hypothetical protein [Legionella anisa]AWN73450.1 hypothetical protein DLD14_06115 [Legionella anisa]KTC66926.1 hypothetical protein Lani_3271 [Legionella anisa]MCW8426321.1 hypothetical protein [Legionella anisa]MCW8447981.1 hypothetical protein [Legionella anisa]PNL62638.1 hypothetical protein A6J39_016280 [Legionella anisa]
MEKIIRTFKVKDSNNNVYVIIEYQTQIPCGTAADPRATRPGLSRFITDKGYAVNKINESEFLLVQNNIPLYIY